MTKSPFLGNDTVFEKEDIKGANVCKSLQASGPLEVLPPKGLRETINWTIITFKNNKIGRGTYWSNCRALAHGLLFRPANRHGRHKIEGAQFGSCDGTSSLTNERLGSPDREIVESLRVNPIAVKSRQKGMWSQRVERHLSWARNNCVTGSSNEPL